MNITKKIDKYLVTEKVSKKSAFKKIEKTIRSVKNDKQMKTVEKMIINFAKLYTEYDLIGNFIGLSEELWMIKQDQEKRIKQELKQKGN